MVEPYYWINGGGYTYDIGAVFLDFEPLLTTYWSALEVYQSFKQGEYSDIVGDENNGCAEPMLDARDKNPNRTSLPDFDRLDNPICHHLKISGSQTPLFDEGFGYGLSPNGIIFDNYGLFRRDFYGNTRYDGTDISSGAIQ